MEQQIFNDRYQVIAKVGAGGMADVYKAKDTVLDRPVAIKVLHRHFAEDKDFVSRFRREAQAAASLNHPNIVSIYDWGSQNSTYFIVMELLDGQSLKQYMGSKGALEPAEAMEIAKKVLSALGFAHRNNIVHRDIKPHNIILTNEGEVKVTDFGIARAGASTMTQTGTILGTAHYLSPEQARGKDVGVTSDLYSMGVVLYEMLTGRVPFDGENPVAIALKHVHDAPARPSELNPKVPAGLQTIILKAMAKNPESRYQSAAEMRNDIMRQMEGMPIVAVAPDEQETLIMAPAAEKTNVRTPRPERPVQAHREPPRRTKSKWPAVLMALLLILGAGAAGGWFMLNTGLINTKKMVAVPDVTSKTLDEARSALKEKGLKLKIDTYSFSNTIKAGVIIEQEPDPGQRAEEGSAITVTVSKGRELVAIPDVTGKTSAIATKELLNAGLELGDMSYEYSDELEQDKVITTDPEAGEELPPGSTVDLVISRGLETIQIPDVIGRSSAEAKSTLEEAGFQVTVSETYSDDVGKGNIIRTVPIAGQEAKKGSNVTIYVSLGPEMLTVPDVRDKLEDEANAILSDMGFDVDVQVVDGVRPEQDNRVISQDPSSGTKAKKGTPVLIVVGQAND